MNERIRELAEQCYNLPDIPEALYYRKFNEEKFALLIVQECISVLEMPGAMKVDSETLSEFREYSQGWINGRKLGIEHLKEHFGVES